MTPCDDASILQHLLLALFLGLALWQLCRSGGEAMRRRPQLWAAGAGFVVCWLAHSLPQLLTARPLTLGLLSADYAGILLAQALVCVLALFARKPRPEPGTPASNAASVRPGLQAQPAHLVLLTANERSLPLDRGRDHDGCSLRLVA